MLTIVDRLEGERELKRCPTFAQPVSDGHRRRFRVFPCVISRFTGAHRTFTGLFPDCYWTWFGPGSDSACYLGMPIKLFTALTICTKYPLFRLRSVEYRISCLSVCTLLSSVTTTILVDGPWAFAMQSISLRQCRAQDCTRKGCTSSLYKRTTSLRIHDSAVQR